MSFRMFCRSRMPVRSLLVAAMVGVLAGCGGGGGSGSAEPEPQKPALSLSWQDSGFRTPVVTDSSGQSWAEKPGRFTDVATSPGGAVHLAWHTNANLYNRGDGYLSSSHDAGATWQAMKVEPDWGSFDFLRVLSGGRLVAGSTMDLPQYWWFSPRLWWSDDDGATWRHQDVQTDFGAPAERPEPSASYVEEPMVLVEHQGKTLAWIRQRTSTASPTYVVEFRDRLYYWNQEGAALTRLPIVLPASSPLPVQTDYEIAALAVGQNGFLYLAIAGEVFRSPDALAWETLPRAKADAKVLSLTVLADGTLAAGLDSYENVYFYNDGLGWRQSLLPVDQEYFTAENTKSLRRAHTVGHILELQSGALLVAAEDLVYASCDRGTNWERIAELPEADLYAPQRLAQSLDGTVWGAFMTLHHGVSGTSNYEGKLLKVVPPAGVAPRDFVKCP